MIQRNVILVAFASVLENVVISLSQNEIYAKVKEKQSSFM